MSENIKMEDLVEEVITPVTEEKEVIEEPEKEPEITPEQDPLKIELERVKASKYTEKEKAEYTLRKNADRVKALGGDPSSILGIEDNEPSEDDDQPLTVGMYKKIQQQSATKTAIQLADEITNETEKELVKYHLDNTIKSTGIPSEDLKIARALVNAVKNSQIIGEIARKPIAKSHSNASSVDAKNDEVKGELTQEEKLFLGKPFNMTREAILKARTK